jgi:23S rRNA pseudouridine1911/1915/1917 synthase
MTRLFPTKEAAGEDMTFKLNWVAGKEDEGKLLRDFLYSQQISRSALTDIKFKGGALIVNEESVTVRHALRKGDDIEVRFPKEEPSAGLAPEAIALNILYEDEYIIVINKPAGMNTIPSREHPTGSLANGLIGHYSQIGVEATTHIVTRLDRDTSGIVLAAKHRHVHHLLGKQQRENMVNRVYEAFAEGTFLEKQGTIEQNIARKKSSIIEREVHPEGQYACTYYRVVQQYEKFAHIELKLKTGRTHQIRVHMSFIHHPLLGDDLYGGSTGQLKRQALHCREIRFIHPVTGEALRFSAPLPVDMMKTLQDSKPF